MEHMGSLSQDFFHQSYDEIRSALHVCLMLSTWPLLSFWAAAHYQAAFMHDYKIRMRICVYNFTILSHYVMLMFSHLGI